WLTEAAWGRVLVEFRALASYDPSLNARYAAAHAQTVAGLAAGLERLCAKSGLQPLVPPTVMAEFLLALRSGLALERAANPAALPLEHVLRMVPCALGFTGSGQSSPVAAQARAPQGADWPAEGGPQAGDAGGGGLGRRPALGGRARRLPDHHQQLDMRWRCRDDA